MKQFKLSLKIKAVLSLGILSTSTVWDAVYGFGNLPTEVVKYQTINFLAGAIVFIFFAKLIREILKGSDLGYVTYVISYYYIAHGMLYILNFIKYWDDWNSWVNNFYEYGLLIPAIMVLLVLFEIFGGYIFRDIKKWMKNLLTQLYSNG